MRNNLRSGAVTFAVGLAVSATAVQAAQPAPHEHPTPPSAQAAPAHGADPMHKMMSDPAKHKEMMARMAQCRDMMSMMMEHMEHKQHKGAQEPESAPHH